jgi:hypothetical protein
MSNNALLPNLFPELFQTERSAERHPELEAQRLSDTPLAGPLRAVSRHATSALSEFARLARERGLSGSQSGKHIGRLFSTLRDRFADHWVDAERSYRGTLLGIRHGVDLVRLVTAAARLQGDAELADFCAAWLRTRTQLVADVEAQLDWFAAHPDRARAHPKSTRWLRRLSQRAPS